ncbi:hypothetical protein DJ535_05665 [Citrobacter murliniae]|uniref:Uncharacterized protein n=1 Tax=Citrobacter murliniae TaxID=67829 RepID=A0ABY2PYS5_9ENTR|nr:hypothetical protein DJ535_05665 [Citrobacter murliniae]
MPDIHVSSCVLSILQVIVIFKPVGRCVFHAGWRNAYRPTGQVILSGTTRPAADALDLPATL